MGRFLYRDEWVLVGYVANGRVFARYTVSGIELAVFGRDKLQDPRVHNLPIEPTPIDVDVIKIERADLDTLRVFLDDVAENLG